MVGLAVVLVGLCLFAGLVDWVLPDHLGKQSNGKRQGNGNAMERNGTNGTIISQPRQNGDVEKG